MNISGSDGEPIWYTGTHANAHLFDMLRVPPILGRTFRPEEDHPSAPPVMLVSYRAWQDGFQGDPAVVGRVVTANAELTTIVGVMPENFDFPGTVDIWMPLRMDPLEFPRGSGPDTGTVSLQAIGRLKVGVSVDQAQTEMTAIAARLATSYPATNAGIGVIVRPVLDTFLGSQLPTMLFTMLGAVFGVLLIACGNVANLLLVRTIQRAKEVAIRTAIGASRMRTVVQVLAEAFVLSVVGAVLGLGIAKIGIDYFNGALAVFPMPLWLEIALDPVAVAFVVGLTCVATLFAGIVPALRASRTDVNEILNDESRGSSGVRLGRISHGLVVAESAVSCALLVVSGLMIRTVTNVSAFDYGFDTDRLFTARLRLLDGDYPTAQDKRRFGDDLLRRLEDYPGVRSASLTSHLPTSGGLRQQLSIGGVAYPTEVDHPQVHRVVVSPGYFDTLEVGRGPRARLRPHGHAGDRDGRHRQRAVRRALSRHGRPHRSANQARGRRRSLANGRRGRTRPAHRRDRGGRRRATARRGLPPAYAGVPQLRLRLPANRPKPDDVDVGGPGLDSRYRSAVAHLLGPLHERAVRYERGVFEIFGTLFTAFGIAALLLATIGLYGVMSFSVSNRTRETGVRMALGAHRKTVLALILRRGALHLAIGLLVGLGLAGLLSQGLQAIFFDVNSWENTVVVATVVVALSLAGRLLCSRTARGPGQPGRSASV